MADIPVTGLQPITVSNLGVMSYAPSIVTYKADFTAQQTYVFDLSLLQAAQTFGTPRSWYADNSQNPNPLILSIQGTQEVIRIPAYSIGMLPITALPNSKLSIFSVGGAAAGTLVEIEFYNYERPPYVYSGLAPFVPGFQVEALAQNAVSLISRNTTLSAGVAANVFPTVATARQCRFRNVGDGAGAGDVAWWNVNATATGSFAAGDRQLQPGEPSVLLPYRTLQRISFFSTGGTRIEGEEWND